MPTRRRRQRVRLVRRRRGEQVQLLKEEMEDNVINCEDYKSDLVLSKDGLKDAASRNLNKQKCILEHAYHYHALLQEMPPGEPPATGSEEDWKEDALKTIKGLLNLHRG